MEFSSSDLPNWLSSEMNARIQSTVAAGVHLSSDSLSDDARRSTWLSEPNDLYSAWDQSVATNQNTVFFSADVADGVALNANVSSNPSAESIRYSLLPTTSTSTAAMPSQSHDIGASPQATRFVNFASSLGYEIASGALQSSPPVSQEPPPPLPCEPDLGEGKRNTLDRRMDANVSSSFTHRIDHHSEMNREEEYVDGVESHQRDTYPVQPAELPSEWDTEVVSLQRGLEGANIVARVALHSSEEFERWFNCFQLKTDCAYRVIRTFPRRGKYVVFKSDYQCNHLIGPRVSKNLTDKTKVCPVKVSVTIKSVPLHRSRSTDRYLPRYPAIVRIRNSHNHEIKATLDVKDRYLLFDGKELEAERIDLPQEPEQDEELATDADDETRRFENSSKTNSRRVLTNIVDDIMRRFDDNPEKFTRSINIAARNYYSALHTERSLLDSLRTSFRKKIVRKSSAKIVDGGSSQNAAGMVTQKAMLVRNKYFKRARADEAMNLEEGNIPEHGYGKQA